MNRAASALCAALVVAAAAYYPLSVIRPGAEAGYGVGNYDIYAYFYPNIRYALDSLARGDGLLWNPYQDCGQPFFAFSTTGLLYPVHWVFLFLPREAGLLATMALNLAIGGLGAWWLGREMQLSRPAALAGALAFMYSASALFLAAWSPMHIGPYVWMPVAVAAVERLLRAPSPRRGAVLGLVLALQLLPGFPQISFFTYLVIALRVAWELATARVARRGAVLAWLALGLALPPLLVAVQFLPSLLLALDSVRSLPLQPWEIGRGTALTGLRAGVGQALFLTGGLTLTTLAVGFVGLADGATRRLAVFYLALTALAALVALGEATPLWALYQRLPGGGRFRLPERLLWVASFALAVACALGVEAALRARGWRARAGALLALAAGGAVFAALPPHTIAPVERTLLAVVVAAGAAAALSPRLRVPAGIAIGLALAANTLVVGGALLNHRLGDIYDRHRGVLAFVGAVRTPHDRVLLDGAHHGYEADYGLTHKTAALYRLPSIYDYEPQGSLRYAQYFTYLRTGRPLTRVFDWDRVNDGLVTPALRRPLLDLTAARYLVVDESVDRIPEVLGETAPRRLRDGSVRVYENLQALPRAFYVPSIARLPDDLILRMLADGRVDPRRVALIGLSDTTAFAGPKQPGTGRATFVRDDPQTVAIDVESDAPGFLFLADQYDPDWTAEVNGAPAPILRANYAFRLVPVPGGRTQVVFRYRPRGLRIGAAVSLLAAVVTALCLWRGGRAAAPGAAAPSP